MGVICDSLVNEYFYARLLNYKSTLSDHKRCNNGTCASQTSLILTKFIVNNINIYVSI
jgi:hypothetical protein